VPPLRAWQLVAAHRPVPEGMKGANLKDGLPVKLIKFKEPFDGLGLSVASKVDTKRHRLSYLPALRQLCIEFEDSVGLVDVSSVAYWVPDWD